MVVGKRIVKRCTDKVNLPRLQKNLFFGENLGHIPPVTALKKLTKDKTGYLKKSVYNLTGPDILFIPEVTEGIWTTINDPEVTGNVATVALKCCYFLHIIITEKDT